MNDYIERICDESAFAHMTFCVVAIRHDLSRDVVGKGLTIAAAVAVGNELITDDTFLNFEIEEDVPPSPGSK